MLSGWVILIMKLRCLFGNRSKNIYMVNLHAKLFKMKEELS